MYDAIVVGARCAGSPTAMLLARKGYRVLLVDRATFPSDVFAGHYIHRPGVAKLKLWGLLDKITASDCPPILKFTVDLGTLTFTIDYASGTFEYGDFRATFPTPPHTAAEAYSPRRWVLDKILVDAAAAAGAELRERFTVEEVVIDNDRVTGVRGRARGGRAVTERGRIVIGADGLRSLVARSVEAPTYDTRPALTCAYHSYWSGIPIEGLEFYPRDRRSILAMPTNGGLVWIGVGSPSHDFRTFRSELDDNYLRALDLAPNLSERACAGRREERIVGTAALPNYFRRPHGPGWALVGDAGYHKDPAAGQGITDAFRDAELLADAIDDGFSGRKPLDRALRDYERRRNDAAMPMYELASKLASLEAPSAKMFELFTAFGGGEPLTASPGD